MVTKAENERLTRVEGEAPMGRMIRENYWVPFAISSHLVTGEAPMPVRLLGENYVAFRGENGAIGFFDEHCPHRRASLALARVEGNAMRCIYHGWKIDVAGCVVDVPTQTVRAEQFAKGVRVVHFPVQEVGGLAWVWLGGCDAPAFPELPFAGAVEDNSWLSVSVAPCNWLQGVEGTIDSAHAGTLHQTWLLEAARRQDNSHIGLALAGPPSYETESAPYGLQAVALRPTVDGRTYARVTQFFMPLVCVVPFGRARPQEGSMFAFAPVDDQSHLLFYGYYSDEPQGLPVDMGVVNPEYRPDPGDFTGVRGDRHDLWGQDRALMRAGHFTGFGRTLLEEDIVVQTSMGGTLDRSREFLSTSDVAVAHVRRILLEALTTAGAGGVPPGSARTPKAVRMPNALEFVYDEGGDWREMVAGLQAG